MKSYFTIFILTALFLASTFTASFAQVNWTRENDGNPVLDPGPSGAWDDGIVGFSKVFYHEDMYHMWYGAGRGQNLQRIGYATSTDGINWIKYDDPATTTTLYAESDPVLVPGQSGEWDDAVVSCPYVLIIDSTFHMWYGGSTDPGLYSASIGHATSADGIHWFKDTLNNPVLTTGLNGSWDDAWVFRPFVIIINTVYHMWYDAWNGIGSQVRIGHATSPHPDSTWVKDPNNPVLSFGSWQSWDYPRVDLGSVIYDGNTFHMWYDGGGIFTWKIGYATSQDGSSWTKHANNPVLDGGTARSWDDRYVTLPSVIFDPADSVYKMWYTGGNGDWDGHIGYATSDIVDGINDNIITDIPKGFVLSQNYPNPFNPSTTISYSVPRSEFVSLIVYDVLGKEVQILVNEDQRAGDHSILFDAGQLSSGIYFYTLQAGSEFMQTRKMLLMR